MRRGTVAALVLFALFPAVGVAGPTAPLYVPPSQSIRGIIFDPSDFYATGLNPSDLAATLVARWSRSGVNVVYMNAYNVIYGAHYRTAHRFTSMDGFGRADLLQAVIAEAHRRGIQVFASFYSHTHRGAWTANPGWRAKRPEGADYTPRGVDVQYFLSVWHPDAITWWLGLIEEILTAYPNLDGIELREPVINWWGTDADFNPSAVAAFRQAFPRQPLRTAAWRRWRADGLTAFIKRTVRLVHAHGRQVHLTSVASAWGDGRLMTAREQADQTGFDLDGVLSGDDIPDALKVELIWQQWGNVYDYATFSPEWTGRATAAALRMVAGRTRAAVHVELTDFGRREVDPEETYLAMRAARRAGARDFDVYGARLADKKDAWPWLRRAFTEEDPPPIVHAPGEPARRVLVLEDVDRGRSGVPRLATALLVNLLGHFNLAMEVRTTAAYQRGTLDEYDAVIYQGTIWDAPLPAALIDDLGRYSGPVLWIGANLWQLTRGESVTRFGVLQRAPVSQERAISLTYGTITMAARGLTVLGVERDPAAVVRASAAVEERRVPLIVRSDRFWFVAGYLFSDPTRNPLQWIVADLLHEVLQTPHQDQRQALLLLTGITPSTDPAHLAGLRLAVGADDLPVLLSVTPVFLDPVTQVRFTLRERPALVEQLQEFIRSGASVVLAGYTHQYRGRTGADYEFWDALNGTALQEDSAEYVEQRVRAGLQELLAAGLVPAAWATPGGLASPFDYTLLGGMFSAVVERRLVGFAGDVPVQQRFPYQVEEDLHGHTVISPNAEVDSRTAAAGVEAATHDLTLVRDALAVVAVPVSTPPSVVSDVVRSVRAQGFRFTDLRARVVVEIQLGDVAVAGPGGTIRLRVGERSYVREYDVARDGRRSHIRTAWFAQPERIEQTLQLPAGTVRVAEIRHVSPWGAEGLRLRLQMFAGPWLEWMPQRDLVGVLRLAVVAISLLSAAIVVVLGVSHLVMRFLTPR